MYQRLWIRCGTKVCNTRSSDSTYQTLYQILEYFYNQQRSKNKSGSAHITTISSQRVSQGSLISPTLYTIYTADLFEPAVDCIDIQFANDSTQIITHGGKSRQLIATRTVQEIEI